MSFVEHLIESVLKPRLQDARVLVVYDEHGRFRDVCAALESEDCKVVFTEKCPISSRQATMERWLEMGKDTTFQSQLVIHTPEAPPKDDEARQQDPYSGYAAIGAAFPSRASDNYKELCYRFLKDRTTEVDQLFAGESEPTFDLIDKLAGGSHAHPRLEKVFDTPDVSKIIPRFLVPDPDTLERLESNSDWATEMVQLVQRTLGLKLDPRSTKPQTIQDKLWQFLLFSEFADDLPAELPSRLADIPRATGNHLMFAKDLCSELRKHLDTKEAYRETAAQIEKNLDLVGECEGMVDLGQLDTFAFEEKNFLRRAVTAVQANKLDSAAAILKTHKKSLWAEEGERKLLWDMLNFGLETLEQIQRAEHQLKLLGHEGRDLCELYDTELVKVDRVYRQLEEANAQTFEGAEEIQGVVDKVRNSYRAHFNDLQSRLLSSVQREGWPLKGLPSNSSSYDDLVAPLLKEGKRVVYLMIDALRLDLFQDIESHFFGHKVHRTHVCAQLPCVTRFGMASLLPEADSKLSFETKGGELAPFYDSKPVSNRSDRLAVIESLLNDRVSVMRLDDFERQTKTSQGKDSFRKAEGKSDLLVLTSTELDELGEGSSTSQLQLIPRIMRQLQIAIKRCAEFKYDCAVVVTDHGFIWVEDQDSGTVCEKPAGNWSLKKRRCLIGKGDEVPNTVRFTTKELSIPTDEPSFVVPKALATFSKGGGYFHEGLSLQESLLARMVVNFTAGDGARTQAATMEIVLSRKKKTVTSRIISINISWPTTEDMFSEETEFKLVAIQKKKEVGFPVPSDQVDSASGLVKLRPGDSVKISLRLLETAQEGAIQVKAIDPITEKTLDNLELNFQPLVF